MLGHTKMRHINVPVNVKAENFRVVCPIKQSDEIKKYLISQGCTLEELIEPGEVFPERSPATLLRGARNREGFTQQQLAGMCGISRHHISEMENNKRTIGKRNALKMGKALNVDPRLFL